MAKPDARNALSLVFENSDNARTGTQTWRFYNAVPLPGLPSSRKSEIHCEQGFRPEYRRLVSNGYQAVSSFSDEDTQAEGALVLIGRNRQWNEAMIVRAWNSLGQGGTLIVAGNKTDGIAAIRKWFCGHGIDVESRSKFHAVVFSAFKCAGVHLSG